MNCPVCNEPMTIRSKDTSYSRRENNKPYERVRYVCRVDDIWIQTEVPQKEESVQEQSPEAIR